jgi:hypothetical protein
MQKHGGHNMRNANDYKFVGWIEVRNVKRIHSFTEDELKRLLQIAELAYDGSHLLLTPNDIEYLCMIVRFNYAKYCQEFDLKFDDTLFNHLQVVR